MPHGVIRLRWAVAVSFAAAMVVGCGMQNAGSTLATVRGWTPVKARSGAEFVCRRLRG